MVKYAQGGKYNLSQETHYVERSSNSLILVESLLEKVTNWCKVSELENESDKITRQDSYPTLREGIRARKLTERSLTHSF